MGIKEWLRRRRTLKKAREASFHDIDKLLEIKDTDWDKVKWDYPNLPDLSKKRRKDKRFPLICDCPSCKKKLHIFDRFRCPYCKGHFCPKHRLPENHKCKGKPTSPYGIRFK